MDLTEQDIRVIRNRLASTGMAEQANPPPRPLAGWEKEAHERQEAKRAERLAAAQAEEDRLRGERERAAEQRAAEWERNRPARERAKVKLAALGRKIQAREVEIERLYDEARDVEQEAKR